MLEVFSEGRLGGETEGIGNLLYVVVTIEEKNLGFEDDAVANPFSRFFPTGSTDYLRGIFGCQTEFIGIEGYVASRVEKMFNKVEEFFQHNHLSKGFVSRDGIVI